jgi:hypothetical protein
MNEIDAHLKILQDGIQQIAGSELSDDDARKLRVLALSALGLLGCLLKDIRRIAERP